MWFGSKDVLTNTLPELDGSIECLKKKSLLASTNIIQSTLFYYVQQQPSVWITSSSIVLLDKQSGSCDQSKGGNIIEFFNNSKLPWQAVLKNIMWDQDPPFSIWRFLNHWVLLLGLFLPKDALFLEFIDLLFIKSRMPIGRVIHLNPRKIHCWAFETP